MASRPDFSVRLVPPDSPDFTTLARALDEELELRYPGLADNAPPVTHDLVVAAVAYVADAPVGCGAFRELAPGFAEIKRMYVLPAARRTGAARRLLQILEDRAQELGYGTIRLGSGKRQPEALALYESHGYRQVPLFGEYEGGDVCVCYEKSLA